MWNWNLADVAFFRGFFIPLFSVWPLARFSADLGYLFEMSTWVTSLNQFGVVSASMRFVIPQRAVDYY